MRKSSFLLSLTLSLPVAVAAGVPLQAQQRHGGGGGGWCNDYHSDRSRVRVCEVRQETLPADRDVIAVDGRANGGITVTGWDRNEILVEARVSAWGRTEVDAEDLMATIEIDYGNTIRAMGPRSQWRRNSSWSVSYHISAPYESNLRLESTNGGIHIAEISGNIDFETTNGGVDLYAVSGDVRGRTTNGGVNIELHGDSWDGAGLDVRTTNGGVHITVPDNYSAHLETGTVNGGMRIDFPITVQGRIGRSLSTDLGNGGQTIRATTTNGGVEIRRN